MNGAEHTGGTGEVVLRHFENGAARTEALATALLQALQSAHAAGRDGSLVVPGGRSPAPLFERLARAPLAWNRVWITLSDERWVAADDAGSNELQVRQLLLREAAAAARFVGLRNAANHPRAGLAGCWRALDALPRPFDAVVLGMGEDGHFASLFPQSDGLRRALDATQPAGVVAMRAPVAPHERISLNLSALLDARQVLLQISGRKKLEVLEQALGSGDSALPVRSLLRQRRTPVTVCWCP